MQEMTQAEFHTALTALRDHIDNKVDTLSRDLTRKVEDLSKGVHNRADKIEDRLTEHAREDDAVKERVALIEQDRKRDKDIAAAKTAILTLFVSATVNAGWQAVSKLWR